ncbi:MAG TPA: hypothetical protein VE439_04475 [Anaerolineae bacterium]|jgi:hypothetical protein|nr:hypothetical protein [Anaerolineae bacterium]
MDLGHINPLFTYVIAPSEFNANEDTWLIAGSAGNDGILFCGPEASARISFLQERVRVIKTRRFARCP